MIRKLLLFPVLLACCAFGQPKVTPDKEAALKADLAGQIDGMKKQAQVMTDSVFSFGELGFQEFETSKYLTAILEKEGFKVERGVAGIPTAFVATWGQGKPVIALGSDIDDIPQASQKPGVGYHDAMIEGAPGHGEGHNSGMPLNIIAALAVKKVMEREHLSGTIKLWPGVAEEDLGTKAYYVRAGVFKDVDIVLFCHVADNFRVAMGPTTSNGLVSIEYSFKGESAHAAGAPWRGKSALDAVELMDVGWNFRREHLRLATRLHYVITNGGDQPNVVPPNAAVWYYYREADYDHIMNLWRIGDNMAQAAALMTDTTYTSRLLGSAWPGHFNVPIAEDMYQNIKRVGLPEWSADDQRLAKGLQAELKVRATRSGRQDSRIEEAQSSRGRRRGWGGRNRTYRRRVGRYRRYFLGRADRDPDVSVQYSWRAWAQLGQRRFDGDAHRAQGCGCRREGAGHDDAGYSSASGIGAEGLGLLQQRADQRRKVQELSATGRQARHLAQSENDGGISPAHEGALLRSIEIRYVSRTAWD